MGADAPPILFYTPPSSASLLYQIFVVNDVILFLRFYYQLFFHLILPTNYNLNQNYIITIITNKERNFFVLRLLQANNFLELFFFSKKKKTGANYEEHCQNHLKPTGSKLLIYQLLII